MLEKKVKVQIKNLKKKYANGDGVEDINLDIYEGEILTMLGPSGCGKSTILRTIAGFNEADEGQIIVDKQDIIHMPPEKRPTGMVFQSYNLWPHMTIYENLAFGLKLRKVPRAEIDKSIEEMLELVKMPGVEKKFPNQLSGGQQQRIAIARTLLLKPQVLLLDEPFSALDAKIRMQMREELKKIQSQLNITVVFVTHDQEEAMSISHRIVVMKKGHFEQVGTPSEIYDNPETRFVAAFIGEMNFIETEKGEIAIRPEDVALSRTSGDNATITSVMNMGHYNLVILQTKYGEVKSYINKTVIEDLKENEEIFYTFKKYRTYKV